MWLWTYELSACNIWDRFLICFHLCLSFHLFYSVACVFRAFKRRSIPIFLLLFVSLSRSSQIHRHASPSHSLHWWMDRSCISNLAVLLMRLGAVTSLQAGNRAERSGGTGWRRGHTTSGEHAEDKECSGVRLRLRSLRRLCVFMCGKPTCSYCSALSATFLVDSIKTLALLHFSPQNINNNG